MSGIMEEDTQRKSQALCENCQGRVCVSSAGRVSLRSVFFAQKGSSRTLTLANLSSTLGTDKGDVHVEHTADLFSADSSKFSGPRL